ncbi:MAG TPA: D-alanine--D-alanine ligase [Mycobacteriales bacterium]|nr:D-alanine--D-alanine ligase [Mycobacteriales bacterium]
MTDLARVLVLAGGLTHERDVSLRSGRRVTDALRNVGIDAVLHDTDLTLLPTLAQEKPDAVWIALHGGAGEDGAVRAVLDLAGVPYAGAGPSACRLAFDKPTAKELVLRAGVPTPPWLALAHNTFRELGAATVMDVVVAGLGLPLMVKPAQGGSALGATVVRRAEDLPAAMVACFSYDDTALLEHYIDGTELAITVVDTGDGPRALPPVEISVVSGGPYDYEARYTAGETEFFTPARLDEAVAAKAAASAVTAHRTLGLSDVSRSDLIVDAQGVPWFLEVNVSPGMTETSLLPLACAAAGVDVGVLCRDLLAAAAARKA